MIHALNSLNALLSHPFDEVIDVRSPSEFAEDHLPGAINLPVLNDDERARVGTTYVQDSRFRARRMGAALVARNAAAHLEGHLSDAPAKYHPLVYCWRGGQRSGSFATILSQIGWRAETLEGGYKQYRRLVVDALYHQPFASPAVVIDGNTGSGKTDLLKTLANQGEQVLDLEGLANHRGSVFGAMPGGQPSQKMFESRLAMESVAFRPDRVVYMEAESSRIGDLSLPPAIWEALVAAPRITLDVSLEIRATYLSQRYRDISANTADTARILRSLVPLQGHDRISDWLALLDEGDLVALARSLMEHHYDPRYGKSRSRTDDNRIATVTVPGLNPADLKSTAAKVIALSPQPALKSSA